MWIAPEYGKVIRAFRDNSGATEIRHVPAIEALIELSAMIQNGEEIEFSEFTPSKDVEKRFTVRRATYDDGTMKIVWEFHANRV